MGSSPFPTVATFVSSILQPAHAGAPGTRATAPCEEAVAPAESRKTVTQPGIPERVMKSVLSEVLSHILNLLGCRSTVKALSRWSEETAGLTSDFARYGGDRTSSHTSANTYPLGLSRIV